MSTQQNKRIAYYDNLRFFLILMVVIGHFIDVKSSQSDTFKSIFLWIYCFHMPLFFFISGLFHKNDRILPNVLGYLMIGFVLKISSFLEIIILYGKGTLSYYVDGGVPWYMFVLAGYTVLSYILRSIDKRFVLIFSVLLGLFSGYDYTIGDTFYASRAIVFYPFFVLGSMFTPQDVMEMVRRKEIRLISGIALFAWAALCIFKLDDVYFLCPLFTGRNPFSVNEKFMVWGFFYRAICYVMTLICGFGVMCIVPQRRLWAVTRFGSKTLQVYFWHYFILRILIKIHIADFLCVTHAGRIAWLLLSVLVTLILCTKLFDFPTGWILRNSRYALNAPKIDEERTVKK